MPVGVKADASVPDRGHNPAAIRTTVKLGAILTEGSPSINGTMAGAIAGATATFTVNDNDFSTGNALIRLGNHILIAQLDFAIGGNATATALNIANAIDKLPGFTGNNVNAVVTATYQSGADVLTFSVHHDGTKTNFNTLVPSTGFFALGGPAPAAPAVT